LTVKEPGERGKGGRGVLMVIQIYRRPSKRHLLFFEQ
jgi:hypothetical protein